MIFTHEVSKADALVMQWTALNVHAQAQQKARADAKKTAADMTAEQGIDGTFHAYRPVVEPDSIVHVEVDQEMIYDGVSAARLGAVGPEGVQ